MKNCRLFSAVQTREDVEPIILNIAQGMKDKRYKDAQALLSRLSASDINLKCLPLQSTLLHHAVVWGNDDIIALLLEMGADPNVINAKRQLPIHLATNAKHLQLLLPKTRDVNATCSINLFDKMPFELQKENDITLKMLDAADMMTGKEYHKAAAIIRRIPKKYINSTALYSRNTLLHHAAMCGSEDIVAMLLKMGANVNVGNVNGLFPKHLSTNDKCTQLLLAESTDEQVNGSDESEHVYELSEALSMPAIDQPSLYGVTALHLAVFRKDIESIRVLLDSGSNTQDRTNEGLNACDYASLTVGGRLAHDMVTLLNSAGSAQASMRLSR